MYKPLPIRLALAGLPLFLGACGLTPQRGVEPPPPPPLAAEPAASESTAAPAAAASAPAPQPATVPAAKPAPKPEPRPAEKTEARAAPKTPPAPAQPPARPAPLALDTLEQRLKDTPAIGGFTKLALKNQVDDLLDRFRDHYAGRGGTTLAQLRQNFEQLIQRVHGLLRDGDPSLAAAILQSREAIWAVLSDPVKFAKL
jgi:hypothetical protein